MKLSPPATFALIVVLAMGAFSFYYRSAISKAEDEAVAQLPYAPAEAYDRMREAFEFNNVISFGRAGRARREFFESIRDRAVMKLVKGPNERAWFAALESNLVVLSDAGHDLDLDLSAHQAAILRSARKADPRFRRTLTLDEWDAFVAAMRRVHEQGVVPADAFPEFGAWLTELGRADRWSIALLETLRIVEGALAEGLGALGVGAAAGAGPGPGTGAGSSAPADPARMRIVALDFPVKDSQLLAADKAFVRGLEAWPHLQRIFGRRDLPPELALPHALLNYNSGAIKVAHLAKAGPKAITESTGYITGLLLRPGGGEPPTEPELYAAFLNGTLGQLTEAATSLKSVVPEAASEAALWSTLAAHARIRLGQATNRRAITDAASGPYRSYQAQAARNPANGPELRAIGSTQHVYIILN